MNDVHSKGRAGLLAAFAIAGLLLLASSLHSSRAPRASEQSAPSHPDLFAEERVCPDPIHARDSGRISEELARIRADRYAYDPGDGVRAVQRYQEARACYRIAAANRSTARVHRAVATLRADVNTDYAAARLNLASSLELQRWSAALSEIRRLLLLTEHLGRHEYVEWLKHITGRVSARASSAT